MLRKLYPKLYLGSIFELDLEELKKEGIKGLIFDIDNTLVPYDVAEPTKEIIELFNTLRNETFKICLMSNNVEDRVMRFNQNLKVFAIHKSGKPRIKSFKRALELMDLSKEEVAIVGDQIFTDVYGGNRMGVKTILVQPVSDKDEWMTKIKRGLEQRVIKLYEKHGK